MIVIRKYKDMYVVYNKVNRNFYYFCDIANLIFEMILKNADMATILEKIRNEYYIDTYNLDDTFVNRLNQKTGKSKKDIEDVVFFIKKLRNQSNTTEKELITFNELLEKLNL